MEYPSFVCFFMTNGIRSGYLLYRWDLEGNSINYSNWVGLKPNPIVKKNISSKEMEMEIKIKIIKIGRLDGFILAIFSLLHCGFNPMNSGQNLYST